MYANSEKQEIHLLVFNAVNEFLFINFDRLKMFFRIEF